MLVMLVLYIRSLLLILIDLLLILNNLIITLNKMSNPLKNFLTVAFWFESE